MDGIGYELKVMQLIYEEHISAMHELENCKQSNQLQSR